jgi:hypothetical protein
MLEVALADGARMLSEGAKHRSSSRSGHETTSMVERDEISLSISAPEHARGRISFFLMVIL